MESDGKKLMFHLLGDENDIPEMPIELDLLDKLKKRVQLARKIDVAQHRVRKEKHEKNWMKEAAEAMEIKLDSDLAEYVLWMNLRCHLTMFGLVLMRTLNQKNISI